MDFPETDLVARARQGDASAFGRLYEHYLDGIYRYIYYRVSDHNEAEDLTETVFLRAWEALPRFRPGKGTWRAWLYRIAHNIVVDRYRTHKANASLDEIHDQRDDDTPTPEYVAEADLEIERLSVALNRLAPRLQEVVLQRFVNGLSHAETARVMGLRAGHVRVLQHRALKEMRHLMEGVEQ